MVYISPQGRNWGPVVNWDDLGKLYASFLIAWTVLLFTGILWLVKHRTLPFLKIRNIPLAITATVFLHVYLIKILLAYTTNGHFLCSAEFWIMSIYLPFGIAFFQANMMQLLDISTRQRKLLEKDRVSIRQLRQNRGGARGLWSKWRALDSLKKTYVFIGIGMLLQVRLIFKVLLPLSSRWTRREKPTISNSLQLVITAAIYGTSEKLQGHWGGLSKPRGQAKCRKGLEWYAQNSSLRKFSKCWFNWQLRIPSSIWQLFWSCLYGPYLLYKVWHVRDTHYWRLQTILCVVSG
jgi:hypothetical protein